MGVGVLAALAVLGGGVPVVISSHVPSIVGASVEAEPSLVRFAKDIPVLHPSDDVSMLRVMEGSVDDVLAGPGKDVPDAGLDKDARFGDAGNWRQFREESQGDLRRGGGGSANVERVHDHALLVESRWITNGEVSAFGRHVLTKLILRNHGAIEHRASHALHSGRAGACGVRCSGGYLKLLSKAGGLLDGVFASLTQATSGVRQGAVVRIGASLRMKSRHPSKDGGYGGGDEGPDSGYGLSEGGSVLLRDKPEVPFGKVIRASRLVEFGLLNAVILAGLGAAGAFGWGILGGKRIQPLWIAGSAAGLVACFWAFGGFATGYVWVPW